MDSYTLDPFGRQITSTGSTPNPYRFGGAWGYITDPSGMLQLGARFYWPEVGRFVSQDPEGDGVNWYAYATSNPLSFVDPEGTAARCGPRPCPSASRRPKGQPKNAQSRWQRARGLAIAFAGVAVVALGQAARKAGDAACGAWRTVGTYAKGAGIAITAIGAYFTWKDTKEKADKAIDQTTNRICNPEGTDDDGTWDFLRGQGLGGPEDNYSGYGMRRRQEQQ